MDNETLNNKNHAMLAGRLAALRRAWRGNAALQGAALIFISATPLPAIGAATGLVGYLRTALLAISITTAAIVFVWKILLPLLGALSLKDSALFAESQLPSIENRLSSAVDLLSSPHGKSERFDRTMLDSLFAQAADDAAALRIRELLPIRATMQLAAAAVALATFYAICFTAVPGAAGRVPGYFAPPYLPRPDVYSIARVSADKKVRIGDPATIRVILAGNIDGAPVVVLEREGLEPSLKRMKPMRKNNFALLIPSVGSDISFSVRYRDARSKTHTILAIEPPRIRSLTLTLEYPAYTGLPRETRENSGDIIAVRGTLAKIHIESTSPLNAAAIYLDRKFLPMKISQGKKAAASFRVMRDGTYTIRITDKNNFENMMPPAYTIRALPDSPPQIQLTSPQGNLSLPQAVVLLVAGSARDDYGISRIMLHYKLSSGSSGALRLPAEPGSDTAFEFPWDIATTGAQAGDTIEFFLSAVDNNTVSGPQTARTPTLQIEIISQRREYEQIETENKKLIDNLERAVSDGENVADSFKKLSQNLSAKDTNDRQKRADIQRAVDDQQALEKELSDISQRMQENIEHMKNNDFVEFDTIQKMNQIQQLMDQILTKEMRELMKKIQQSVNNIDLSKLDRNMLESLKDQEKILRNLDNTLQRLKRIQAEQKMDTAARRMKELTERQKQAAEQADALKNKQQKSGLDPRDRQTLERLAREENNIKEELTDERNRLDDLKKEMEKLSPDTADNLEKALRDFDAGKPENKLEQASSDMKSQRMKTATQKAEEAHKSMLSLTGKLGDMNENYSAKMSEAMRKMVMHALRKTLNLSAGQEDTMALAGRLASRPGRTADTAETNKLTSEIRFQRDVAVELAAELLNLANVSMSVSPSISETALSASAQLTDSLAFIKETRLPEAYSKVQNSYRDFNRIALSLLDASERGESGDGQSELEKFMSQLQSLADSQEGLNSMTKQLGSSGLPMPQLMSGMQALAAQQQVIREGLSKLSKDAKGLGELDKRMEQIEQQMEDIQDSLREGRADQAVQRRQSDVLRRLRDATLSLKKETLEDKRIAETGRLYTPSAPKTLQLKKTPSLPPDVLREIETLRRESRTKGYEDAIENYYRQILKPK